MHFVYDIVFWNERIPLKVKYHYVVDWNATAETKTNQIKVDFQQQNNKGFWKCETALALQIEKNRLKVKKKNWNEKHKSWAVW